MTLTLMRCLYCHGTCIEAQHTYTIQAVGAILIQTNSLLRSPAGERKAHVRRQRRRVACM